MINFQYDPATLALITKSPQLDLSPLAKLADQYVNKQKTEHLVGAVRNSGMIPNMTDADATIIGSHPEILGSVYKASLSKRMDPSQGHPSSYREFELTQKNPQFGEWLKTKKPDHTPSNVAEWGAFQKLTPEQQEQYLRMKRADKWLDTGPNFTRPNIANPASPMQVIPKDLAQAEMDKGVGDARAKFYAGAPKLMAAQATLESQHGTINDEIKRALPEIDKWGGSGMLNLASRNIPGTPGYRVKNLVDTLKSNIGFDKLQEIRDNSPTGGALGALAVQELFALQSVFGSLETAQDAKTLKYNLGRLSTILEHSAERRRQLLETEFSRHKIDPRGIPIEGSQKNQARFGQPEPQPVPGARSEVAPPLPVEQRYGPAEPPGSAVEFLKQNATPEMIDFFEKKYNLQPGAAKRYLMQP